MRGAHRKSLRREAPYGAGPLIRPALDQIVDERLHRRGVFGRALDEAERMSALAEAAMEGRLPRGFCIKRLTDLARRFRGRGPLRRSSVGMGAGAL